MKTLNVAVLGQGRSGLDIHCNYLPHDTERFRIAAVVDALPERREKAARLFSCDTYADYTELFGRTDIDLVVNALPSHYHPPVTIDLLEHGFNVLTEKPMARTAAEVDAMIAASEKSGKMLAVFQQSRFAGYYETVKSVLASGKLGRILQISIHFSGFARRWDWQCCQEFGAGSLYNTGPHPLDQALDLLDYRDGMPDILCRMDRANTFGDAEDYVKLILTAPDRPLIDMEVSSCNAYPNFTYNIQGTRGGLQGSLNELKWRYFKLEEAPEQHLIKTPLMKPDGSPAYCSEQLTWYEEEWKANPNDSPFTGAVGKLYSTLYEHLVNGKPLVVTPQQVRQQIAVIERCHEMNPLSRMD
ncbi:MAG: Gfo/Idh/MocA family oxidoreductase [Ruminococcaceae bacterium]|nr:Gfo/Idh/MocA family oxidoreductase [Oscillospiraceae bacterium]